METFLRGYGFVLGRAHLSVVLMFFFFYVTFQYSIDQWQRRRLHARFNIFSDERKYGTRAQHIYHMDEDINVFAAPGPVQFKWASQEMSPPDVRNIDVIPLFFFNAIIAWQVAAAYDTHPHT